MLTDSSSFQSLLVASLTVKSPAKHLIKYAACVFLPRNEGVGNLVQADGFRLLIPLLLKQQQGVVEHGILIIHVVDKLLVLRLHNLAVNLLGFGRFPHELEQVGEIHVGHEFGNPFQIHPLRLLHSASASGYCFRSRWSAAR